jgi:LmbE family N-acetylglucosaminyl deacetylase
MTRSQLEDGGQMRVSEPRERALSPLNLFYQMMSHRINPNSCDLVVLDGHLDHRVLKQATWRALQRHPVLSSYLLTRRGEYFWRVPRDQMPVDFRIHSLPRDDPGAVDACLTANIWGEPLALESDRPVRFHLIETPRRSYFQTIHTHVYADATSCYTLTQDIAESYAAHMAGRPFSTVPIDAEERSARALSTMRHPIRARLKHIFDGARMNLTDLFRRGGGLALPERPPGPRAFSRVSLDPRQTKELLAAARNVTTTLHNLVKLAFFRAADGFNRRRGARSRPLRVWDFFSLRSMAPPEAASMYDCMAVIYPVGMNPAWSDEEALRVFKDQVHALRAGQAFAHTERFWWLLRVLGAVLPLAWLGAVWPYLFKSNVFLTNPGVCPSRLDAIGGVPVIDYVTFPQLFVPAKVMLVVATFRDRLRILAIYDRAAFDENFEDALFTPFLAELRRLSGIDLDASPPLPGLIPYAVTSEAAANSEAS